MIGDGARVDCVLDPEFNAHGPRGRRAGRPGSGHPSKRGMERFLAAARAGDPARSRARPPQATASLATALACERALQSGGRVSV